MERQLNAGFAWTDLLGPSGDQVFDFALRYPGRLMAEIAGRIIKIVGFFPGLWWDAGIVGKVIGGILSVVILVIGIGWAS